MSPLIDELTNQKMDSVNGESSGGPIVPHSPLRRASLTKSPLTGHPNLPFPPVHPLLDSNSDLATLVLADGSSYKGYSFGANKSISGECVFQTGKHSSKKLVF
jgi:hypothetical protein